MSSNCSRLFFALDPEPETRSRIERIQASMEIEARPVRPANLHMTLLFLGNVAASRISRLLDIAARLEFSECEIVLNIIGRFKKAGVAWLGCDTVPASLGRFQSALEASVMAERFTLDSRLWKPHVTLYRNLRTPFETIEFEALRWKPRSFCLMQSRRARNGVLYEPLGHWPARF